MEVEYDSVKLIYSKSFYLSGNARSYSDTNLDINWYENGKIRFLMNTSDTLISVYSYYPNGNIQKHVIADSRSFKQIKEFKWDINGILVENRQRTKSIITK